MPRSRKRIEILATLIGVSPGELRGDSPQVLQSMVSPADRELTEDEHRLLKAYRKMKELGRKAIRAQAGKLLEQQGVSDADNPYGKGRPN